MSRPPVPQELLSGAEGLSPSARPPLRLLLPETARRWLSRRQGSSIPAPSTEERGGCAEQHPSLLATRGFTGRTFKATLCFHDRP